MSTYRAQQAPRSTTAHRPLMAAALGIVLGAGFLASGASLASAAEADPFCSEYEVPETVAPVEVSPNEVTAPVTVPEVVPVATVPTTTAPEVTVPPPPTTQPVVVVPAAVVPAEEPAPTTPKTSVLGEVVVNDQSAAPTLPVTGLPTGELLMGAAGLLIAGEGLRRLAARRVSEAIAAEMQAEMMAGAE
ncbi:MAG: hypothetical protein AB7V43_02270 [Acidimicrobiia bacterium]